MKKLNAAIIGLGRIGFQFDFFQTRYEILTHFNAYMKSSYYNLVAVCDNSREKRDYFKSKISNIPVYSSYKEMINNHKIDVISICTLPDVHHLIIKDIVKSVKGIFCEKPICNTSQQAKRIIELCKKNKVKLSINYTRRWDNNYLKPKQWIKKYKLGNIINITSHYYDEIFNFGSHMIDMMNFYCGIPKAVQGHKYKENTKNDPALYGMIFYKNNSTGILVPEGSRHYLIVELDILCENGRIKILDNGLTQEIYKRKPSPRYKTIYELIQIKTPTFKNNVPHRFVDAVNNLYHAVVSNKPVNCTGQDGYYALQTAQKLVESSQKNGMKLNIK